MTRLVRIENGWAVGETDDAPDYWEELDAYSDGYIASDTIAIGDWVGPGNPPTEVETPDPEPPITRSGVVEFLEYAAKEKRQEYASRYPSTSIGDLWPQLVAGMQLYQQNGPKPYPSYPELYGALSIRIGVPVEDLTEENLGVFVYEVQRAKAAHIAYLQKIERAYRTVLAAYDRAITNRVPIDVQSEWAEQW
jgi:hypothetical protein